MTQRRLRFRRLRWAWHLREWPWSVPSPVVRYLALPGEVPMSDAVRTHAAELAARYGLLAEKKGEP